MTDTEIIKALEYCSKNTNPFICTENKCPLFGEKCIDILTENALDLINRLKAENKNCGVKIQNQREQLKATNEKIKELSNELREAREDAEKSKQMLASLLVIYDECEKVALKEFADRLKERAEMFTQEVTYNPAFWVLAVKVEDIDNLLKEMG